MIDHLLSILPGYASNGATIAMIVVAMLGVAFWLAGAKVSRPTVTLLLVSVGAIVGLRLPYWFNWTIDGMGPAVGLAAIMGVSGYVLHRMWVGIGLGAAMAFWAALGCWISLRQGRSIEWGDLSLVNWATLTPRIAFAAVFSAIPVDLVRPIELTGGAALLCGIIASILWDRAVLAAAWSATGVSMMAVFGLSAVAFARPQWLGAIKVTGLAAHVAILAFTVVAGAALQWYLISEPNSDGAEEMMMKSADTAPRRPSNPNPIIRDGADRAPRNVARRARAA